MSTPSARKPVSESVSNRTLLVLLAVGAVAVTAFYLARPWLPDMWRLPGSPPLQSCAIAAVLLFGVPVLFWVNKRTGAGGLSPRWFSAHVGASVAATVLALVHSAARIEFPPILLLLAIAGLIATGVVARVVLSRRMAGTFGTKRRAFQVPDESKRAELRALIEKKTALLADLDPAANEGTFSVTLRHVLHRPGPALRYRALQRRENQIMGIRASVGRAQGWWRPVHVGLAYLFVLGVAAHIVTVTFFAGYVAGGREIYWWHLTAW